MDLDAVKSSYARWAPIYDSTFGAVTRQGRRHSVGYINRLGISDVLEVGVGTGLALPLYKAGLSVTGIDYSEDMLAKAHDRVAGLNGGADIDLRQMDARELDFPDASFDAVSAMHFLSVVPEPDRVMAEIVRVLRPGGRVVIANHFARDTGALARLERWSSGLSDLLGWHSDFEISVVTGTQNLELVEQAPLPPMGMMTFLVLEKSVADAAQTGTVEGLQRAANG